MIDIGNHRPPSAALGRNTRFTTPGAALSRNQAPMASPIAPKASAPASCTAAIAAHWPALQRRPTAPIATALITAATATASSRAATSLPAT